MNQKNQKGFQKPSRILIVLCFAVFFLFNLAPLSTVYGQTYQTNLTSVYTRITSNMGGYMVSLPNDYASNSTKQYPLLISLPGIGERGDGSPGVLEKVSNVAVARNIKTGTFPASFTVGGVSYSFIVVTPEMADASPLTWAEDVYALLQHLKAKYRVNAQKVYLSGLSLGGSSTWQFSTKYGDQLAAAVLISSGAAANPTSLKTFASFNLPIWAIHNETDLTLNSAYSKNLVAAINGYTGIPAPPKALLTIFPVAGHDAWTKAYTPTFKQDGLNVFEWMLSKTRGTAQPAPSAPVITANGGANQVITLPTNTVTLDASASKVSSGTIASYTWTKVSGPSGDVITPVSSGLQAKITGLVAGTYQYQLTIKSSYGNTASVVVTVTVNPTLQGPTAVITGGGGGSITLPANRIYLSAESSKTSTGGAIAKYAWSYVSGPAGYYMETPNASNTYINNLVAGTYVFKLTITDASGLTSSATMQIVVKPAAGSLLPPTAVITGGGGGSITLPANRIYLSAESSKASTGGAITKYAWSYVSGPSGYSMETPNASTTYINNLVAGTYVFKLTVTDASGLTSSATMQIVVNPAAGSLLPPTAVITGGGGGSITLPANSIYLQATSSKASTGGAITKYAWSYVSGPASYHISAPTGSTTYVYNLLQGTYVFKLTITDASGLTSSATIQIVVKPAPLLSPTAVITGGGGGSITLPANSIYLQATSSKASTGGSITKYAWSYVSGPASYHISAPTGATTYVYNLLEGTYVFKLIITEESGLTSSATISIVVKAASAQSLTASLLPPTAVITGGGGGSITLPANSIYLQATSSKASTGGAITKYAWSYVSGPASYHISAPTGSTTYVYNLLQGTYVFKLIVTDASGLTSSATITIVVKPAVSGRTTANTVQGTINNDVLTSDLNFKVSPNPVQSDMNIALSGASKGKVSIIVYDVNGKSLLQQEFVNDGVGTVNKSVNLSKLPSGIYIVQAIVDGKYKKSLRIVKQ